MPTYKQKFISERNQEINNLNNQLKFLEENKKLFLYLHKKYPDLRCIDDYNNFISNNLYLEDNFDIQIFHAIEINLNFFIRLKFDNISYQIFLIKNGLNISETSYSRYNNYKIKLKSIPKILNKYKNNFKNYQLMLEQVDNKLKEFIFDESNDFFRSDSLYELDLKSFPKSFQTLVSLL
jgi:hypothetical protein